jgi:3-deoxy-D-manno-octulosonic-acid transferase
VQEYVSSSRALPTDARRALLVYRLGFPLVFAALLPGFLRRMLRRGNFREHFAQRLGRFRAGERMRFANGRWIWIHSISVGETLLALKLAREIRAQTPAFQIALSVTTSTGFALAQESAPEWLAVLYNPIDTPRYVRATLDLIRPERLLLIEGEVWPNLVAACCARNIPVALVNARLSPRSERRLRAARNWAGPIFRLLEMVTVPEHADVARWMSLGVLRERIHVTGSIKFDATDGTDASRVAEFRALLARLGVKDDARLLLGGSTWAPEEKALAEISLRLRVEFPDLFLILVPRHIERAPEIVRALAPLPLRMARRTAPEPCDVLLVDTTGELRDWYALADVVFVGKSLPGVTQTGGQNPAEAAALGTPVLCGPHMENFTSIVEHLIHHGGACTVTDAAALERELATLLRDAATREKMGAAARVTLASHAGATARTARLLLNDIQSAAIQSS